jgi:hypothetical protein
LGRILIHREACGYFHDAMLLSKKFPRAGKIEIAKWFDKFIISS